MFELEATHRASERSVHASITLLSLLCFDSSVSIPLTAIYGNGIFFFYLSINEDLLFVGYHVSYNFLMKCNLGIGNIYVFLESNWIKKKLFKNLICNMLKV